jgi:hypothetical protein
MLLWRRRLFLGCSIRRNVKAEGLSCLAWMGLCGVSLSIYSIMYIDDRILVYECIDYRIIHSL